MTQGFFQFNNSIINEILNFATSSFDLIFLSGPKGSAKSETISKVIPELEENNLIFQHFCFESTVINDFLLNFYDALRNFSLAQKISLKKFTTDNFQDKVSHYFKTIDSNCIIIVENFERIEDNVEIINFLSHLATYENVKIIIVSRNSQKNLFRFKPIKVQTLDIEQISKEEFKEKISILTQPLDDENKEKFYNITNGLELYLKMSAKYCATTGIKLSDLIDEFERKNLVSRLLFEEFIVSKFVSLTPNIYQNLFKTLCTLNHPVSKNFIEAYNLGDTAQVQYLSKNFLVSFFRDEIYVKDYFKQYITKTFSIQEKITRYKKMIDIYEQELAKSPKDRLLRLSRESIRKEIEVFNSLIPGINTQNSTKNLPYLGLGGTNWSEENLKPKSKLTLQFEKIKERKNALSNEDKQRLISKRLEDNNQKSLINENKEKNRKFIINLINSSRELTKNYKYNDAISELSRAKSIDYDNEFKIELLGLIAKNYEYLNDYSIAQKCYIEALKEAKETDDSRVCKIEYDIAQTNVKLFKIEIAKEQFEQIAYNTDNPLLYRARAFIELGEILENSSINDAIKQYNRAISLAEGKNKELACRGYYRLAVLYDENNDTENAIKYYQKNYLTSSEKKENKYYSISLTNLAQIYIELSKYRQASEYLKLALQFDSENNDFENMYFSQKELAKLYLNIDENQSMNYYKQALLSAQNLKDNFKEALVYFEIGEFNYDKQEDEKALINFLRAKHALKNNPQDENIIRINSRIQDIKVRLNEATFRIIMERYDK